MYLTKNLLSWETVLPHIGDLPSPTNLETKSSVSISAICSVTALDLTATEIDSWIADPYHIYAKKILRLRQLDPLDRLPDAALRGNLVHESLALFIKKFPDGMLPDNALGELENIGRTVFAAQWHHASVQYFWTHITSQIQLTKACKVPTNFQRYKLSVHWKSINKMHVISKCQVSLLTATRSL